VAQLISNILGPRLVADGTDEIQRNIIAQCLLEPPWVR